MHEAIAILDAESREVLLLRDLEGMTGEETARAIGITEAAMKSRLHRARSGVRAQLIDHAPDVVRREATSQPTARRSTR